MTSCMKLSYAATPCPTLDKNAMPHWIAFTRSPQAIAVPYSRGGRSEAQHNAPRQGSALPPTACQTTHNV